MLVHETDSGPAKIRAARRLVLAGLLVLAVIVAVGCTPMTTSNGRMSIVKPHPAIPVAARSTESTLTFAIIGDYGSADVNEAAVATLVTSWNPSFIVTLGDNYYARAGGDGTAKYDRSVGAYYCRWLKGNSTTGALCRVGLARINAFFPALGNHDYRAAGVQKYLAYFDLPGNGFTSSSGNERYYDFVEGPIHFYAIDSNTEEPAGTSSTSIQATWLKSQLSKSGSRWNVVYFHHPPYSSDDTHGSIRRMQWPFARWGADAVLSGHSHNYERVMRDGIFYFVNGLGGSPYYGFSKPVQGSTVRYTGQCGAQKVTVSAAGLDFEFFNVNGRLVDACRVP